MRSYFTFNDNYHDYWPIYEAIRTFYPIGIRFTDPTLFDGFEGQKKLSALMEEQIQDPVKFQEFSSIVEKIGAEMGYEAIGTTYGLGPSRSFEIILEKTEHSSVVYSKKLCAAISLLGNFYTIYGVDETIVRKPGDKLPRQFWANNAITASPTDEFREPYLKLKQLVRLHFPGHRQVPFFMLEMYLHGLYNRYDETCESTIYMALFNQHVDDRRMHRTQGNRYFGSDEWLKEGVTQEDLDKQGKWISMPPEPRKND